MKISVKTTDVDEAFTVSKTKNPNGKFIAYIDPAKPENKETFKYKQIFKDHGAKWDGKYWFWYVGETKDQWQNVFNRFIKPALEKVHGLEGASEVDSKSGIIASLDALINAIDSTPSTSVSIPVNGQKVSIEATPEQKAEITNRLEKFKETLVNLDSDEEFKNTIKIIKAFKNAQGHQYSFNNSLLIWIQSPKSKLVKSGFNWEKVNHEILSTAKPIWIWSPAKKSLTPYTREEKQKLTTEFLKRVGKNSYNELGAGEKERLGIILRGRYSGHGFDVTAVFDIKDTKVMEGKEDLIDQESLDKMDSIKWAEDDLKNENVRPIFDALMNFAKEKGINVSLHADLGGAKGSSSSGSINILQNEGNDVGLTKTLAHELAHELLHQTYLSGRDPLLKQYFIGKSEGRGAIEQQAELSAWMILAEYGFDLKTTSINYAVIWGADKDKMVKVFDTVSNVVNMLLGYIDNFVAQNKQGQPTSIAPTGQPTSLAPTQGGQTAVAEDVNTSRHHVTPEDVAKFIGVEAEYNQALSKVNEVVRLRERFNKLVNK